MTSDLVVGIGWAGMVVLAVSVLGTVTRRERTPYVVGVLLVIGGMTFLADQAAGLVALVGLLIVLASTIPLLRE